MTLGRRAERAHEATAPARPATPARAPSALLRLQQAAGNRAVARLLTRGGLDPDAPEPDEIDEAAPELGGLVRPLEDVGLARQGTPGAAPPAPRITVGRQSGPTWTPHGGFDWRVSFATNRRSGWIVQEITNAINVTDAAGAAVDTSAVVPHYWEAWAVDGTGKITPSAGKVHDMWIRPARGTNTKGSWSMAAKLHFTTTDPATQGFTAGGVSNAGILLSTTTQPTGLGPVRRWRGAHGRWDDNAATPVAHTGSTG